MLISIDVYSDDIQASADLYVQAIAAGAIGTRITTSEDYRTKKFEHCNIMFEIDHHATELLDILDAGPFERDSSDL
jgi:aspartate ammonia-lyase